MIQGLGTDIVEIKRIARMIEKYGESFLAKVYTDEEREYCGKHLDSSIPYAGRWAMKEAFYKALPPECQNLSKWKSVQLVRRNHRKPMMEILDTNLLQTMADMGITSHLVSISHERSFCVATVILQ